MTRPRHGTPIDRKRRLLAWGLHCAGMTYAQIGIRVGSLNNPARPIGKQRAFELAWGGRRLIYWTICVKLRRKWPLCLMDKQ